MKKPTPLKLTEKRSNPMFDHDSLEEKIQKNTFKIEELSIHIESIDRQINTLLEEELKVTPEQLSQFIQTKDHFTEENWNQMQEEKARLSAKLETDLKSIRNPQQQQKRYAERAVVGNHWLFVR
ncbi:hypothetical protein pah_c001o031 [Parachlamydia acanthamoebae str. Hall's coccus]|nr:hypothetical protein pah_c001o031 [Parachlamydia acanthamoebae str. Hall's coccus]